MYEFNLVLLLLQQMCVFLVIAWLMSKTRLFIPLMQVTVRLPHKLLCYVTFPFSALWGPILVCISKTLLPIRAPSAR
jgi:two-component system LytT family sensor kinase